VKTLKPPAFAYTVIAAIWLCALSLWMAGNAVSDFNRGYPFTAFKCAGVSIIFLSGCCDPVNWLWNLTPFFVGEVVQPCRYVRYFWCFAGIGYLLVVVGWFGDGWLLFPPAKGPVPPGW